MITTCPVCGKGFDILWPHLWAYKRGNRYLCSWKCIRLNDNAIGKEEEEMSKRMKKDGTPAKKPGPKPKKMAFTAKAIETPEGDWTPAVKVYGPLKVETPEPEMIQVKGSKNGENNKSAPLTPKNVVEKEKVVPKNVSAVPEEDEFENLSIRSKRTGNKYEWSKEYNLFSIKSHGDELALALDDWKALLSELPSVAKRLGVEL